MNKLNVKLRRTSSPSLIFNDRDDIRLLMKVFNEMHDKVNELVEENNKLNEKVKALELSCGEKV